MSDQDDSAGVATSNSGISVKGSKELNSERGAAAGMENGKRLFGIG